MSIQLISVKRAFITLEKTKDTIEDVEFTNIISYKTSLLGAKIESKINIFKFHIEKLCTLTL